VAQQVTITIESDLSGKPDAEPVRFGLDGTTYEVDLTEQEAERFRKALSRYVAAGRKVTSSGKRRKNGR
jgi:hypothetical protein